MSKSKALSKTEILAKHKLKFASKFLATPILMGVHYRADGAAVITDRHQMLVVKDVHSLENPLTIHAKTGEIMEGKFPDVEKIMTRPKGEEVKIKAEYLKSKEKPLRAAIEVAKLVGTKDHPIGKLGTNEQKQLVVIVEDTEYGINFELVIAEGIEAEIPFRSLNTSYLFNAISVFIDAYADLTVILPSELMQPIMLTDDEKYTAIVLPYRINAAV